MRIIGGIYRGKKLLSPLSEKVRPTSDQAREAVFNILFSKLEKPWADYALLDLFAGSGAFALEAISRGARNATLIDADTASAARNISLFPNEKSKLKLIKADAINLPAADAAYDIIFLDAPYRMGLSERALLSLLRQGWTRPGTILVAETAKDEDLPLPPQFELIDCRTYGIAKFTFMRVK